MAEITKIPASDRLCKAIIKSSTYCELCTNYCINSDGGASTVIS